ncbi:MAG: cytochrome c [Bauldia sp.]|nr:cytochrome c [Bauldia sp.]
MKPFAMLFTFVAAGGLMASGDAHGQGIASEGGEIAARWCAPCHRVSADQPIANADVPGFAEIAARSADDYAWLATFLADPHPPMPDFSLTRQEIADLVAYIASLR